MVRRMAVTIVLALNTDHKRRMEAGSLQHVPLMRRNHSKEHVFYLGVERLI